MFTREIPLRPTVSSRGSINYEVAKELSRILRSLVGKFPHHIKITGDFVQQVKGIILQRTGVLFEDHLFPVPGQDL